MNNQYNIYCLNCCGWKLHAKGRKYYTCLTCNTRVDRASAIQPPLIWGDEETKARITAAQALRAIPSEKRAQASRENGNKGGRPKGSKNNDEVTPPWEMHDYYR
jgi:hypothetical protein